MVHMCEGWDQDIPVEMIGGSSGQLSPPRAEP